MMQKRRLYNTQNQNEGYGGMCKGAGELVVVCWACGGGCSLHVKHMRDFSCTLEAKNHH